MKVSEAFASNAKYLKSEHLNGRTVTVTISHVTLEKVGSGTDAKNKPILYFQGKELGLALNVTNATILENAYGDEMDDWSGERVELYTEMVMFEGKRVPGLRVRPVKSAAPARPEPVITSGRQPVAQSRDDMDSDIPFAPEIRG